MKEALQSINARILTAIELIEQGKTLQAQHVLNRLSRTMPLPDKRHFESVAGKEKPPQTTLQSLGG